jgi:hypothetical protein
VTDKPKHRVKPEQWREWLDKAAPLAVAMVKHARDSGTPMIVILIACKLANKFARDMALAIDAAKESEVDHDLAAIDERLKFVVTYAHKRTPPEGGSGETYMDGPVRYVKSDEDPS